MSEDFINGLWCGGCIMGALVSAYFHIKEENGEVMMKDIKHLLLLSVFYLIPVGAVVYVLLYTIVFLWGFIKWLYNLCV